MPRRVVLLMLTAATVGCDRVTKHIAEATLAAAPARSFLGDTVRLEYSENAGAFLGLGAGWPVEVRTGLFTVGTALLLVIMIALAFRHRWSGLALAGLVLFVSGGASNLADRVARGRVIDFMNVGIGSLRTGIFNVADVAIMLGVALVVVARIRSNDGTSRRASNASGHDDRKNGQDSRASIA